MVITLTTLERLTGPSGHIVVIKFIERKFCTIIISIFIIKYSKIKKIKRATQRSSSFVIIQPVTKKKIFRINNSHTQVFCLK